MCSMSKITSKFLSGPQEAVKLICPGDIVCASMMDGIPHSFLDALAERVEELPGLRVYLGSLGRKPKIYDTGLLIDDYFFTSTERGDGKPVSYVPVHLSDTMCGAANKGNIVAVLQTSVPDSEGYVSMGPVPYELSLLDSARCIILQVNPTLPYVYGESRRFPLERADAYYYLEESIPAAQSFVASPEECRIAELIAERVPDGACLQLGIGTMGDAVGKYLKDKKHLGIHTEIFTDPMIDLIECGAVDNSQKGFKPGVSYFGASLVGSRSHPFIDKNPAVEGGPFSIVNDPRYIAMNKKVLSVNGALQVDLMGQVCAESIGHKQFSGTGGQLDFVRGARWSEGGMSFIAFPSARSDKTGKLFSKISLTLPAGSAVTTPRADVQYIATEYGIADLRGKSLDARARALISIAHPQFRDELFTQAKQAGIII